MHKTLKNEIKLRRKLPALFLALILAASVSACSSDTAESTVESSKKAEASEVQESEAVSESSADASEYPSEKDDYYEAVNGALIDSWTLDADESNKSIFSLIGDENDEKISVIIKTVAEDASIEKGSDENNIRAFYLTGMDTEARNEGGYGEYGSDMLRQIDEASSTDELIRILLSLNRTYGLYSLIGFSISADMADSDKYSIYLTGGDTGLSREIWFSDDESNKHMQENFKELLERLLVIDGANEEEAVETTERVTVFMKDIAENSLSAVELADPSNLNNYYTIAELEELTSGVLSTELLQEIFGFEPEEEVIVTDVEKIKYLASVIKEKDLDELKEYVKLCLHKNLALFMDIEGFEAIIEYNKKSMGQEESEPFEELLMSIVQELLGFQTGRLFCNEYYDEETTEAVTEIINEVISVYDERIAAIDWMSDATKEQARKKLANITINVGHPEVWPQDKYELVLKAPEEGGLFVDNYIDILKAKTEYMYEVKDDPVDKSVWPNMPQVVNAYYSPQDNSINILAGILQAPFFDINASEEENLGAIGTVIGHEISHAFDISGSQFDEEGNLKNWWTDEDREQFNKLAGEMIEYYNGFEINGTNVNGELTISENIADMGGVSCVTEIAQNMGYDLKKVYESFADIWAEKYRGEYLSMLMAVDVHSPAKIRVNAVLSAQQAFRDLYGIEEGDGMYHAEMPGIW